MTETTTDHKWPEDGEHLFGEWHQQDRTTIYRICVHPECKKVETKKVS